MLSFSNTLCRPGVNSKDVPNILYKIKGKSTYEWNLVGLV